MNNKTEQAVTDALPERDTTKTAEQQGLFRKFDVRRVDGSDQLGGKHHGCRYYVLDVDHDPYAAAALGAYADACRESHPELARDLREKWGAADTINTLHAQLAEAQAALKTVMRNAELSKEPCDPDPESPAAIRNGKFAGLASIAAQGLGMVRGPSLTEHLVEAQKDAERWRLAAQCARLDQFGGFVVTPDEPAFAPDVSLAFTREIDVAIDAAKGPA